MTDAAFDFGSLNDALARSVAAENLARSLHAMPDVAAQFPEVGQGIRTDVAGHAAVNLLRSAGPVSDRYIMATDDVMLIVGPTGSGKTTASAKKILVEAQRMSPGPGGVRRYVCGVYREKYDNLWKATIPSWWKIMPATLPGSKWVGSSPRAAQHIVNFEDGFGRVQLVVRFGAFGDDADPLDLAGNEFMDCYLNEMNTMREDLISALAARVGRDPPFEISRRTGAIFGDCNAPDVLNHTYRNFYEDPKPGYALYRQPGGLDPDAENIQAVGRAYYEKQVTINAHRPWWAKIMVHNKPGMVRSNDPVYPTFDDDRNRSPVTLEPLREIPVLVGVDGGLTPAAVYGQEKSDGQFLVLAEIGLERGGMRELATAMLALEAARFQGCAFVTRCDPAMGAGEDTADSSDRMKLATYLAREVKLAATNNPDVRFEAVRAKLRHTVDGGAPGLLLDPSVKGVRRGFNQTFAFRDVRGSNDRGSVQKSFDSHVHDALQYAALECGSAEARRRTDDIARERQQRREASRNAGRYSPFARRRGKA